MLSVKNTELDVHKTIKEDFLQFTVPILLHRSNIQSSTTSLFFFGGKLFFTVIGKC